MVSSFVSLPAPNAVLFPDVTYSVCLSFYLFAVVLREGLMKRASPEFIR